MKNTENVSFGLRKIITEQFAVIESSYNEDNENIELGTGLRFGFNLQNRFITTILSINFSQEKNPFLILEIGCFFEIIEEDWDKMYNVETKEVSLSKELARHLVVLTVGTIRGVLHAKTENTPFNKFYLPTINVNNLVEKDITIKTNKVNKE